MVRGVVVLSGKGHKFAIADHKDIEYFPTDLFHLGSDVFSTSKPDDRPVATKGKSRYDNLA